MPRKAASDAAAADSDAAPRRSTRISSQPATATKEVVKEKKPKAESKAGKKREAEDEGKGEAPSKKAKSDHEDSDAEAEPQAKTQPKKLSKIDLGDFLPSIILKNEKDEDVDVGNLASVKGVILFLVPKADTPGCTNQACAYRDIYSEITPLNFDVYCVSADTTAAQSKWQTKKNLPYSLLSDRKRELITALGAGTGGKTTRSHFIFEKGGKLVVKMAPVKAADSARLALEYIKSLEES